MDKVADPMSGGMKIVEDATCTYCTCMCDDIVLSVEQNRIVDVKNACGLGRAWFIEPRPETRPVCTIGGREATLEAGEGIRVLGRGCPCSRLDDSTPANPCEHDRVMLERLLGAPVRPLDPALVPHDFHCGYLVAPAVGAG